jgi:hypothetical protein
MSVAFGFPCTTGMLAAFEPPGGFAELPSLIARNVQPSPGDLRTVTQPTTDHPRAPHTPALPIHLLERHY